jgi:hypothetical protein
MDMITKVHNQKKQEIETIVGCKFQFDDPEPSKWIDVLNSVLE